ncbi:MAG: fumarylacetoacetate hydrolase family protein, partial [Gaiellaceae bacterium]|nr:fumarylacetoacetate hydrolase family protein [Gaiellaceae bacterium]
MAAGRYIRYRTPRGELAVGAELVERSSGERLHFEELREQELLDVLGGGARTAKAAVTADPELRALDPGFTLVRPLDPPEVWCAGVTYERSRDARVEESVVKDAYALVYEARRPELFLKDAACRRTVGPGEPIGIRDDATWTVPEPEIALVLGERGAILGLTIGNDVSSRDIEGANPLYLPQAKVYAGACAIGPAVYVPDELEAPLRIRMRILDSSGRVVFEGETSTARLRRSYAELVRWLLLDNPVPAGSVLLTGTGLVPPDDVTLVPGHLVEISVPEIGTLVN